MGMELVGVCSPQMRELLAQMAAWHQRHADLVFAGKASPYIFYTNLYDAGQAHTWRRGQLLNGGIASTRVDHLTVRRLNAEPFHCADAQPCSTPGRAQRGKLYPARLLHRPDRSAGLSPRRGLFGVDHVDRSSWMMGHKALYRSKDFSLPTRPED